MIGSGVTVFGIIVQISSEILAILKIYLKIHLKAKLQRKLLTEDKRGKFEPLTPKLYLK